MNSTIEYHLKNAHQTLGQARLQWDSGANASAVLKMLAEVREHLREAENRLAAHAGD